MLQGTAAAQAGRITYHSNPGEFIRLCRASFDRMQRERGVLWRQGGWISVDDRMPTPDNGRWHLCLADTYWFRATYRTVDGVLVWLKDDLYIGNVATHWKEE